MTGSVVSHLSRSIAESDPQVADIIRREEERQQFTLELIASENHVSRAVREANGTVFTNKYAEGYPGKRYYGGCVNMDAIEDLARDRLKKLFGCEHANVQPHSGAQANSAVYMATLHPGDTLLSLDLAHGGHLSHGLKVNMSGTLFHVVHYGVERGSERISMDAVRALAREHKPKLIVTGASAYPRQWDFAAFAEIAKEVGARLLADVAHFAGLMAVGLHPTSIPYADFTTSTTHKTLRGPRAGLILSTAEFGQAINKSVFPGTQGGPLEHVIAAKAVAFGEALTPDFKTYAKNVVANAKVLAEALIERGFAIVSGGTDTHLMLVDLRPKNLTGKVAEKILDQAGITVNKNTIPDDPQSPFVTSGIRLGTPALTTRGMGKAEMRRVAELIDTVLTQQDEATIARVKGEVGELTKRFPLYPPRKRG